MPRFAANLTMLFGFLLRHLDRIGYRGWIGCEYRPRAGTVAGLSWMEEWR